MRPRLSVVAEDLPAPGRPGEGQVVRVGAVAHGGHCVARLDDGRVAFVRHTLPGELVRLHITGQGGGGRYVRADAVEVIEPAPGRRPAPCPWSGPGRCGGCDWQHVDLAGQRRLKEAVLAEALERFAGMGTEEIQSWDLMPREVPGAAEDGSGLGWRTRVRYAVDRSGHIAMRAHRSHDLVSVDACPLGTATVVSSEVGRRTWLGVSELEVVDAGDRAVILTDGRVAAGGSMRVHREAGGNAYRVRAEGFWQVHVGAADALVEVVRSMAGVATGDRVLDLYAGVGLFARALADDTGPTGRIDAVESAESACADARRNLHGLTHVGIHAADVTRWLRARATQDQDLACDLVVLDPPRAGAGAEVVDLLAGSGARRIVYVACDPVAMARDVGRFRALGWDMRDLVALDLFPNTHHVEAVVALDRAA